jgi:hypothetical protein
MLSQFHSTELIESSFSIADSWQLARPDESSNGEKKKKKLLGSRNQRTNAKHAQADLIIAPAWKRRRAKSHYQSPFSLVDSISLTYLTPHRASKLPGCAVSFRDTNAFLFWFSIHGMSRWDQLGCHECPPRHNAIVIFATCCIAFCRSQTALPSQIVDPRPGGGGEMGGYH